MICIARYHVMRGSKYVSEAFYLEIGATCVVIIICSKRRTRPHDGTVGKCSTGTSSRHTVIYRIYGNRYCGTRNQRHVCQAGDTRTGNKESKRVIISTASRVPILLGTEYIIELDGITCRDDIKFQNAGIVRGCTGKCCQVRVARSTEVSTGNSCRISSRNRRYLAGRQYDTAINAPYSSACTSTY